ncbi:MAG: hypothetical protein KF839_03005 [Nitrosomonas sp.]|nr:hypothetical protein [Nitrosomonas sp.]
MSVGILVLLQILFTYLSAFQLIFGTVALDVDAWARIIATGLVLFFIIEFEIYLLWCSGGEELEGQSTRISSSNCPFLERENCDFIKLQETRSNRLFHFQSNRY